MWLQPEVTTPAQIGESVVVDRFVRALSTPTQWFAGTANTKNTNELVALVEQHLCAEDFLQGVVPKESFSKKQKPTNLGKSIPALKWGKKEANAIEDPGVQGVKRPNCQRETRQNWAPIVCCH